MRSAKWLLFATLCSSASACQTAAVPVPDFPVCQPLLAPSPACQAHIGEDQCGHCIYYRSRREVFIGDLPGHMLGGKTWSEIDEAAVILPALESWSPLAAYLRTQNLAH